MKIKNYMMVLFVVFLCGCASVKEKFNNPTIMYDDHNRPLRETGVVVLSNIATQRFHKIDQKECGFFPDQCNFWVRLTPGKHTFLVSFQYVNLHSKGYIKIEEFIKPRHTYLLIYALDKKIEFFNPPKKVGMKMIDLGEHATATVNMNMIEKWKFTPKFD